jgi:hypothetical protein
MFAIHSVFILKENILFLEEWIDYHILLGFNKFYLYDNSKVSKSCDYNTKYKNFKEGIINKYGVDYDSIIKLTNEELYEKLKIIKNKYKCVDIIEWCPKDKYGNILYNQVEAHNHCLERLKNDNIEWCANIDMDEFIVINNNYKIKDFINTINNTVSAIYLSQRRFDSRFNNLNKPIISIDKMELKEHPFTHSNKIIYRVNKTDEMSVHSWRGRGYKVLLSLTKKIWFNHYKLNHSEYKTENNINKNIKENIEKNYYNNYIKIM